MLKLKLNRNFNFRRKISLKYFQDVPQLLRLFLATRQRQFNKYSQAHMLPAKQIEFGIFECFVTETAEKNFFHNIN